MAANDITPTQVDVRYGRVAEITLGEDVTVLGQLLRYDNSLNAYTLAFAAGTTEQARIVYMAMETGLKDSVIKVVRPGASIDLGAVLSPGIDYALSSNLGRIAPYSDLVATNIPSFVGIAITTSLLDFNVVNARTALV
jgi:hypothetical protein